ncbi:TetR/AcrR family transcriptional regulator [Flavimaricola marinus]|uniref:HTH-type transcriptional repressor KstR n=1 Tax=Flavimaricola marinus TaxID=1819565 RepID=A0A238LBZ2_9RHOB|nr:TetR/AcrR family transcriptional regulator [Flavimaricola marinus]SMY06466.1 HTH-type transcriptional repressor KstR [Flavimaricola marinus]
MKQSARQQRRDAIEAAAYDLLDQGGYEGLSMQGLARAAKASNETLYRWYGDKTGLFRALVDRNAEGIKAALSQHIDTGADPLVGLSRIGPELLGMLVGRRAIALNRAAAADATGTLGEALGTAGRDAVAPLLGQVFAAAAQSGQLSGAPAEMAEVYITNLVGDWQVRRVTRAMAEPDAKAITDRANAALARIRALYPGDRSGGAVE